MRQQATHRLALASFLLLAVAGHSIFAAPPKQTPESVPGEVLVNIVDGSSKGDIEAIEDAGDVDHSQHVANVRNGAIWRMHSRGKNTDALIAALQHNPKIAYAEPNYIVHATATSNDPLYSQLYALQKIIGAEQAWDVTTGSSSVVVGVVDTGIDYTHPDLSANVWSNPGGKGSALCAAGTHGYNALTNTCDPRDDHYHGTHVSGTIGAVGNNGVGVVGVNWTTSIMGLKFLDATGSGSTAGAIAAIDFAVQAKIDGVNVRVLSNSWGGLGFSKALLEEINKAAENDILFVASAGNDAVSNDVTPHYPANYSASNVISVAATDSLDQLASFSDFGATTVHLGAPGVSIESTYPGGSYATLSGTSMAAPHVAGAAALLLAHSPSLTTAQVKSAILSNTEPLDSLNGKTVTGGRLSLARLFGAPPPPAFSIAITPASQTIAAGGSTTFTVTIAPDNGFNEAVTLSAGGLQSTWTALFSPNPATTTSTLTIWTTPRSAVSSPITVFGQSSHSLHTATATLSVTVAPPSCLSFGSAVDSTAGNDANSVATADFNRDGKADFVAPDVARNRVVVMFGGSSAAVTLPAGTAPLFVAAADVNGDGKPDIVTANSGSNDVSVLIGNGDGTFQPAVAYSAGASPFAIAVGDFNRDGKLDLVTANNGSSNVSVLIGNGDGTFQNAVSYGAASGPYFVSVADLNRDGKLDLVIASFNADNVSVLLGNGDGSFQTAVNYGAGDGPTAIAVGDWNGDGRLDLAVSNYNSSYVSLLAGNGDGTFAAATNLSLVGGATSVAAGDLDGDGKTDLVVAARTPAIALFTGNGDGTFAIRPSLATSALTVNQLAILDTTGDGRNDVVAAITGFSNGVIRTFPNSSSCFVTCGVVGQAVSSTAGSGPAGVATGDFNGDGKTDIAVANINSNNASILLGNGNGSLQPAVSYAAGNAPHSVAAADVNRDGKPDLVVADSASNMVAFLAGNANGTFQAPAFAAVGTTPQAVAIGDFDRDGKLDVVTANSASNNISLLRGNGDGTFATHVEIAAGTAPVAVAAADVNRDGILDVAVANSGSNNVSILLGNGNGTFVSAVLCGAGSGPSSIAVADLNRDGRQDLVVANAASNNLSVLLGNGDGTFQPQVTYAVGTNPSSISVGDFDGDGKLDIAVADRVSNDIATLHGNGDGTFALAVSRAAGTAPASIAVADLNGDGKPDVVTANASSNDVSIALDTCPLPDLTISKSHSGTFVQGDSNRVYTITVSNAGSAGTTGLVTVADTLPAGLSPVAMSGTGWTCSTSTVSCTRQDSLAAGASYPAISLTVRVSTGATSVTNSASVSGGGEKNFGNDTASDPTSIIPIVDLAVTSSHSGDFTQGDSGRAYTVAVKNRGGAATSGTITVTDTLPAGLTPTSIYGTGWSCNLPTLTCTRGDSFAGGASAPPLTVTFDIAAGAPSSVVNIASVSGGNEADTTNDVAHDLTVIWKRNACGAFGAANNYTIPYGAFTVMSGDFNDDGNRDLVAGISDSSQGLAVLPGNADGSFAPATIIPTTSAPGAVRVADFDGDGKPDILMSRTSTGVVAFDVLRGNGNGTFAPPITTQFSTTSYYAPSAIVVDDFNLDSNPDLVFSDSSSNACWIALGRGDGTFDPPVQTNLSSAIVPFASADFNGDGRKDLVARIGSGSIGILIGDGNGGFAAPVPYSLPNGNSVNSIAVCDLNGDGRPDLAVSSYGVLFTLLGNGDGSFAPPARVTLTSSDSLTSMKTADVNGDGKQDLIVSSNYGGLYVMTGDGTGGLTVQGQVNYYSYNSTDFVVGDFNHDGTVDIATPGYSSVVTYLGGCSDVAITKSHSGNFRQGQTGATYTLRVKNLGPAVIGSLVTVTDQLPAGMTATAISGYSWTCDVAKVSCTTTSGVSVGSYYGDITVTVSVAVDAASSLVNTATVTSKADRNPANNTATDPTTITPAPDLTLSKTHTGSFGRGQSATYTITVQNVGGSPTTGQVQVTENPPQGLTIVSMSGTGWTCQSNSCTRTDALAPNTTYPPITVTATVAANAPLTLTNVATVSTTGEGLTSNNSASDPTQIMWEPMNVSATAATSSVSLTWSAVAGASSYVILRRDEILSGFVPIGTSATTAFLDQNAQAGKSYLYEVRGADGGNPGPLSAADLATMIPFTDDPIVANVTTIKAVHIAEIRAAINAVRTLAVLPPATFEGVDNTVFVKASHITELRAALDAARAALGLPAMSYIDPGLSAGFVVKASHIQQLRAGVK